MGPRGGVPPRGFAAKAAAGLEAHRRGAFEAAVAAYRAAYAMLADADIAHNLGAALRDLKRPGEAAEWFRRCIAARPGHALAHANLGLCLSDTGAHDAARVAFDAALALDPRQGEALRGRAALRRTTGDATGAEADLRASLAAVPGNVQAAIDLGRILAEARRFADAAAVYDAVPDTAPGAARLLGHKGTALFELNRPDEAEALLRRALDVEPGEVAWPANLSLVLLARRRDAEAAAMADRALALDPDNPKLLVNKAAALKALGQPEAALPCLRRAVALRPGYAVGHNNLGNALREQGLIAESVAEFRAAVAADPAYLEARSNLVYTLNSLDTISPAEIAAEHAQAGAALMAAAPPPLPHGNDRDPARRLRIGYVSPDFVAHSVAYFTENLLAHHDRGGFEVVCYSTGKQTDGLTPRLRAQADLWREAALLSDAELDAQIRADRIDILVDLAGHTANGRLGLFARRPAPVQVTWIGYPNTTGLPAIGYRIVDAITDPPGEADGWAAETLVRLPRGFLCYRPSDFAPPPAPRPAAAGTPPIFGSFNHLNKTNDRVVQTWSRILAAVPGSRLLLKQKAFADPGVQARYRDGFARHGVAPERLELAGRTPLVGDHLAIYAQVDIALDPFPYNGTTTTCEALYQGVPVVTLAGAHHVARVGASLLTQVGLAELVATDPDDYVRRAVALARDPARLAAISAGLRPAMARSALLDAPGFLREAEAAFRDMWRRWCAGGAATAAPPSAAAPVAPPAVPVPAAPAARPPQDPALAALLASGATEFEAGRAASALQQFAAAVARFPDSAHAALNHGVALRRLGRLAEARAEMERAEALDPAWAPPPANLAGVLIDLGAPEAAEAACRRALARDPRNRVAQANLGFAHAARQRNDLAIAAFETALTLGPPDATLHVNLAAVCTSDGRLAEAAAHCEAALRLDPGRAEAHANLAAIRSKQGRRAEARAATMEAVRLKPELRHAWSNLLLDLNYADDIDAAALTAEHRAWGETMAGLAPATSPRTADPDPARRLRLGFVSPDFQGHSVAFFLKPLFDALDPAAFEICCYSDVLAPDIYTDMLRARAGLWRDGAGMTDAALAAQIAADRIDILIDLAGHTARNRLGAFARRPAPVQATWLGYPATTGLAAIDHRLVDAVTDPPGSEALAVERLARLPVCFLCYGPPATSVEPGPLPAPARGQVTFGSFNNISKLGAATIALWARVLAAVPDSRMLLKSRNTRDAATRARLTATFEAEGVAPGRLAFVDWQPDLKRHLQMYRQVDIALDSFPYNGTTTTCEAHWMGVPVVTLAGDRHAARVGASLSQALGLGHLVARDPAGFAAIAARLAADLPALAAFRAGARARMRASPLLDARRFAQDFAAWARAAWAGHCGAAAAPVVAVAAAPAPGLPAHRTVAMPGPGAPVLMLRDDPGDDARAELLAGGEALAAERAVLDRALAQGDRVIDLAPGPGDRALLAARRVGAGGTVRVAIASAPDAALLAASAAGGVAPALTVLRDAAAALAPAADSRGPDLLVLPGAAPPDPAALDPAGATGRLLAAGAAPLVLLAGCGPDPGLRDAWSSALARFGMSVCLPVPGLGVLAPRASLEGETGRGRDARQDGPLFACTPAREAALAARGAFAPALAAPLPAVGAPDRAALRRLLPFAAILAEGWTTADLPPALAAALADWLAARDAGAPPAARLARLLRAARGLAAAEAAPGAAPVFALAMTRVRLELELGRRDAAWTLLQRFMRNEIPVAVGLPFLPPAPRLDTVPLGRAFAPWYRVAIYETAAHCVGGWRGEAARLGMALCEQACATGLQASSLAERLRSLRQRGAARDGGGARG